MMVGGLPRVLGSIVELSPLAAVTRVPMFFDSWESAVDRGRSYKRQRDEAADLISGPCWLRGGARRCQHARRKGLTKEANGDWRLRVKGNFWYCPGWVRGLDNH